MGCGHSKINIYPKRTRNKNCSKKSVTPEKTENEDEEAADAEAEANEKAEDSDRKTIKVKPFGGPLLAHTELSSSQNNFFKMLDEKIESGPDYDSSSETERASEQARLTTLLKDWETASSGSRSLPTTPKRRPGKSRSNLDGPRSADLPNRTMLEHQQQQPRIFNPHSQSAVHQSYGVTQGPYRQSYTPVYQNSPPPHQPHPTAQYSSALQYQAISPMYTSQSTYQPPLRQYSIYNQQGSPLKTYASTNSPKHIPYEPQPTYSPNHKLYSAIPKARLSNGDLIQQQIYQQQVQYQQAREFQQYKQSREHQLIQQQGYTGSRSYQSTVHIPIVMPNTQTDITHREQYELT